MNGYIKLSYKVENGVIRGEHEANIDCDGKEILVIFSDLIRALELPPELCQAIGAIMLSDGLPLEKEKVIKMEGSGCVKIDKAAIKAALDKCRGQA